MPARIKSVITNIPLCLLYIFYFRDKLTDFFGQRSVKT